MAAPSLAPGKLRAAMQQQHRNGELPNNINKKSTISQYFSTTTCVCDCGGQAKAGICDECLRPARQQRSVLVLSEKMFQLDRKLNLCESICRSCCARANQIGCISIDCPVLFMLNRRQRDSKEIHYFRQLLMENF